MLIQKLPNIDASQLTVTSTATLLYDLIEAAAGQDPELPVGLNGLDIFVETNDIRVSFDGNEPTTTKGILLVAGQVYQFRGEDISALQMIATGSDATVGILIGTSNEGEPGAITIGGSAGGNDFTGNVSISGDLQLGDALDGSPARSIHIRNTNSIAGIRLEPTAGTGNMTFDIMAGDVGNEFVVQGINAGKLIVARGGQRDVIIPQLFQTTRGTDLASASDIDTGVRFFGNYMVITGTTTINTMREPILEEGCELTIEFEDVLTVNHNAAGTYTPFLLAGNANLTTTAGAILKVVYNGTGYKEVSRTLF